MSCDIRSIAAESETQILPEHEESKRALDLHDDEEKGLTGSGSSILSLNREQKEVSGPPEDHLDLEKGINPAETELVGFESGQGNINIEEEGKCRVCHLVFAGESGTSLPSQLGCNCKDDLSIAHRECAEAWFKIKGDRLRLLFIDPIVKATKSIRFRFVKFAVLLHRTCWEMTIQASWIKRMTEAALLWLSNKQGAGKICLCVIFSSPAW